jgi:hypothetical protein
MNCGAPNNSACEYSDGTCMMSYTTGNKDLRKCFNAAKLSQLGWYPDRTTVVDLEKGEQFVGKVIGVNDYPNSIQSEHTLVLEIKNPVGDSYFLTYNRKKGMNSGTLESIDKIVIVQAAPSAVSWKIAQLGPGETYKIDNFLNGRDLEISTGTASSDGNVDYIPVNVKQQTKFCSSNNDCVANEKCTTGECNFGVCVFSLNSNCCGNSICEASDNGCNACPEDCSFPTNCNEIDGKDDGTIGGFENNAAFGVVFDVTVTTDVFFYEIEADLTQNNNGVPVKVYTKEDSYSSASGGDLNNWEKIFDGISSSPNFFKSSMTFSQRVFSESGSTRAFYISYTIGGAFFFGLDLTATNVDGTIFPGKTLRIGQGSSLPTTQSSTGSFLGGLRYDYKIDSICADRTDRFIVIKPNVGAIRRNCAW